MREEREATGSRAGKRVAALLAIGGAPFEEVVQRALDLVLELGELPAQLLPALFRRHRLELLGRDAKKAPHQPHDLAAHPCAQRFPARFRTLDCGARKPRKIERIGSMPAQIGPRKIDRPGPLAEGTSRNRRHQGQRAASCFASTNEHEQKRRRILTQRRQLMLTALRAHPDLAGNITIQLPECDYMACTMCGDCVRICPLHANDLVNGGRFTVEPTYCIGCGLCAEICEEHALSMKEHSGEELVVPDPEAEKKAAEAAKAKAEAEKLKREGKEQLNKILDKVEKLAE